MKAYYIDHFDSFTNNLIAWLTADQKLEVTKVNCDDKSGIQSLLKNPAPVILSPGPGSPKDYPLTVSIIEELCGKVPLLCICLGHQLLAYWSGCELMRVAEAFHGTTEGVQLVGDIFQDYTEEPLSIVQTKYHSLTVDPKTLDPQKLRVTAYSQSKEILGIRTLLADDCYQAYGWQLHPESFLSRNCDFIRSHFIDLVSSYYKKASKA